MANEKFQPGDLVQPKSGGPTRMEPKSFPIPNSGKLRITDKGLDLFDVECSDSGLQKPSSGQQMFKETSAQADIRRDYRMSTGVRIRRGQPSQTSTQGNQRSAGSTCSVPAVKGASSIAIVRSVLECAQWSGARLAPPKFQSAAAFVWLVARRWARHLRCPQPRCRLPERRFPPVPLTKADSLPARCWLSATGSSDSSARAGWAKFTAPTI